ncbi:hypothetical protein U9M48_031944 [Paspalum notatum var. saurae]|uniref:Uncharacterized protein n=1 Tax=Paspalum notatum var. saurae TaxID=547442 RepID=A0AAQ3U4Z0_PASNO
MNEVLRPFLRRCVLVFFNNILIYNAPWSERLQQTRAMLETLRANQLSVKRSKCGFRSDSTAYLGHERSAHGLAMDSSKEDAVSS